MPRGLWPPAWSFGNLEDKLQGFLLLVESHYRYYQFYVNMFVAAAFAAITCLVGNDGAVKVIGWPGVGFLALELVLFAGSRDTLRKYYARTHELLDSWIFRKDHCMTNGIGHHSWRMTTSPPPRRRGPVPKADKPRQDKRTKSRS